MKRIALALFAAAGLAATAARADHLTVNGSVQFGPNQGPGYYRPAPPAPPTYYAPRGYWTEVAVNVWVPGRWVVGHDRWGRRVNVWEPAHTERRMQRVWVDARGRHDRHWNG